MIFSIVQTCYFLGGGVRRGLRRRRLRGRCGFLSSTGIGFFSAASINSRQAATWLR
jgi:hypothetical protein